MARAVLGLTEQQLADMFHLKLRAYRRYEAGSRVRLRDSGHPGLNKLATQYGVNLDWLLSHEDTRRVFLR
jgi:transcriptional regulator with XRE-family HTH domain